MIFNPAARGEKARRFRRQLDAIGAQCAFKATTAPGDARRLAAEAVRDGFDLIAAAGGDGTVNEVLNGIGDAPDGFARARLGVLPLGTVNVFARELKIPLKVENAWEVLQRGHETKIDLPRVEFSADGVLQKRYFCQLAGAGLDARAIELVDWQHKKQVGKLAYVIAGLKALCEKKPTRSPCDRRTGRSVTWRTGAGRQRTVLRRVVRDFAAGGFARRTAGHLRAAAYRLVDVAALRAGFAAARKTARERRATFERGNI